jgi:ribose transport system substrate-binding protein
VQQPYEFGYQSVQLMAKVLGGDRSVIPADKLKIIPTLIINRDNVDDFTKKINQLRGKS